MGHCRPGQDTGVQSGLYGRFLPNPIGEENCNPGCPQENGKTKRGHHRNVSVLGLAEVLHVFAHFWPMRCANS